MIKKLTGLLLLLFITGTFSYGQFNPKRRPYTPAMERDLFREAIKSHEFDDEIFETRDVPERWKNESVVVLGRRTYYMGYINPWNNIGYYNILFRVRIKLQDITAVEAFSEYYFDGNENVEITIEKPDGTRNEVDLDDAVDVKEKVNVAFFGNIEVNKYKKLAIANLEPGDIIDVVSMHAERFNRNYYHWTDIFLWGFFTNSIKIAVATFTNTGTPFSIEKEVELNGNYPTVAQKVEFDLGKDFYLNFRALNGAPTLDEEKSKSRKRRLWVFMDTMREKSKDEIWSQPMYSLPAVKYQIVHANRRSRRHTEHLIDKRNKLKTEVTTKDIQKIARNFYKHRKQATGDIYYKFYKTEGRKIKGDQEFIEAFYNHYRNTKLYGVAEKSDDPVYEAYVTNANFMQYMMKILDKRGIKYTLIMGVPRSYGGMDGLLTKYDVMWGLKVNFSGEEKIFTGCDLYAEPGEIKPAFEELKLYEITPAASRQGIKIEDFELPASSPKENLFAHEIKVDFQNDWDTVKITRKTQLKGMSRYNYRWQTFSYANYYNTVKDYLKIQRYFVTPYVYEERDALDMDFLEEEEQRMMKARLARIEKGVKEKSKEEIENDYFIVSYDKLKVLQTGLEAGSPDMIFEEEYRLRDLLDNNGDNTYILKAGEFIDGQIEVKDKEERDRQGDIVFPYARSYTYDIEIKIPGNMKVAGGIEQLNRRVENEVGSFVSSATVDGATLKIKVEKNYKNIVHSKDKWEDLLKFVDEAADFRCAKLILTR